MFSLCIVTMMGICEILYLLALRWYILYIHSDARSLMEIQWHVHFQCNITNRSITLTKRKTGENCTEKQNILMLCGVIITLSCDSENHFFLWNSFRCQSLLFVIPLAVLVKDWGFHEGRSKVSSFHETQRIEAANVKSGFAFQMQNLEEDWLEKSKQQSVAIL